MNITKKIEKPKLLGLETKAKPILQEEDCRRIEKAPVVNEASDGHKAGPNQCTIVQEDSRDAEDQPIGDTKVDDNLSTLIGAQITTTETATMTQHTVEALLRGRGPA